MFSLVIPTFNEKDNIKPLLDAVTRSLSGLDFEVIIVDDDSPDGTAAEVLNYKAVDERVRLIVRRKDKGLSSAVIAGFERAKGDVLGVMDADLSHDQRILPRMIKKVKGKYDMVIGTRSGVKGWGWDRKIISAGGKLLAKLLLRVPISDPMSGFFVIKKKVFDKVKNKVNPIGFKIMLEIYYRAMPLKVAEEYYVFTDRVLGESKVMGNIKGYVKQLYSLRFSK